MNLKLKATIYGGIAIIGILVLNLLVLSLLGFPIMAVDIIMRYALLFILLIGGFGLQVGLFVYLRETSAITCSTTATSGGISGVSMILCCSHYILNLLPFLGAVIGISALTRLTNYVPHFLILGIVSNIFGVGIMYYQTKKYGKKDE